MAEKAIELTQHKEYLDNVDPFDIPLDDHQSLTSGEDWFLTTRLFSLYDSWIRTKFEEHSAESLVLCNRKVVYASKNRYEPTDEKIAELEDKLGKPCYVITREPMIEERVSWSGLRRGDYYPTLEVYLGDRNWDDEKVFSEGSPINCDFDTGNPDYTVLDAETCRNVSRAFPRIIRVGSHLGRIYRFYPCMMNIGVTDGEKGRCLSKIVEGIEDWSDINRNPYKIVNSDREGFVGRDIMLELLVKITLDPESKESTWQLL